MSKILLLTPRLTEKTVALARNKNVYVFDVPKKANKHQIAEAVKAQFNVTPTDVNTIQNKPKPKGTLYKGRKFVKGSRSAVKKGYVELKKGDKIAVFLAAAEEPAETPKAKKESGK